MFNLSMDWEIYLNHKISVVYAHFIILSVLLKITVCILRRIRNEEIRCTAATRAVIQFIVLTLLAAVFFSTSLFRSAANIRKNRLRHIPEIWKYWTGIGIFRYSHHKNEKISTFVEFPSSSNVDAATIAMFAINSCAAKTRSTARST